MRSPSTGGYTLTEEQLSLRPSNPILSPVGATAGSKSTEEPFELVRRETELDVTRKDAILPCFSLGTHRRLDHFFGRQDVMKIIDDYLLPPAAEQSEEQLRGFAICGLGGMGKTELAVEYAYSRRDKFDAVFWLSADDSKILASNFAQIAHRLGLEDHLSDLAAGRDVAMGWLLRPLKKTSEPETAENLANWLIIYDNVDNLDVLHEYWPEFGRGSVLLTSRDPFAKHNRYVEKGINLSPLSESDTEAMMQGLTHVVAEGSQKEALSAISERLDGFPLAINQISSVFRSMRVSYTNFLKFCNEEGITKVFEEEGEQADPSKVRSLATLWALDQLGKETRALLQVICILDPDNIPEELLIDKSSEVMLDHYPKSRKDYYHARKQLVSSSLIAHHEDQEKLSVHRLIQGTAKGMMNQQELVAAFQAAASLVISAWPFQSMKEHHSIARFSKCEDVLPSVLRLKDGLERPLQGLNDFLLQVRLARLFNDTGW